MTATTPNGAFRRRERLHPAYAAFAAMLAVAFTMRAWALVDVNLWEDEIIAATHASLGLPELLVNVIRHDMHPPLYFLQLHVWGLVSLDERWLALNSFSWSLAMVASVWRVCDRLYGREAGLVAAAVAAALPMNVALAQLLRMYPMLSTVAVWLFYAQVRALGAADASTRRRRMASTFALGAALIAIHAIGFYFVFFMGLYALTTLAAARAPARRVAAWLALYAGLAAVAAPMVLSALLRGTDEAVAASADGLGGALASLAATTVGGMPASRPAGLAVGLTLWIAAVAMGLSRPDARRITLCLVVLPSLTALAIGFAAKPMFKAPAFASFTLPFVAVAAGIVAQARLAFRAERAAGVGAALGAILLVLSGGALAATEKATNFPAAAAIIRADLHPGDVVYVPEPAMFWGMSWHLVGPDWGSPLKIADPPNERWRRVYALLGDDLVARLGLLPESSILRDEGVTIVTGRSDPTAVLKARRVWLVTYVNREPPPAAIFKGRIATRKGRFLGLELTLLEAAAPPT